MWWGFSARSGSVVTGGFSARSVWVVTRCFSARSGSDVTWCFSARSGLVITNLLSFSFLAGKGLQTGLFVSRSSSFKLSTFRLLATTVHFSSKKTPKGDHFFNMVECLKKKRHKLTFSKKRVSHHKTLHSKKRVARHRMLLSMKRVGRHHGWI